MNSYNQLSHRAIAGVLHAYDDSSPDKLKLGIRISPASRGRQCDIAMSRRLRGTFTQSGVEECMNARGAAEYDAISRQYLSPQSRGIPYYWNRRNLKPS